MEGEATQPRYVGPVCCLFFFFFFCWYGMAFNRVVASPDVAAARFLAFGLKSKANAGPQRMNSGRPVRASWPPTLADAATVEVTF